MRMRFDRRQVLTLLGLGWAASVFTRPAQATLVRGLTLETLATRSHRIFVGTAVHSSSRWEDGRGRRRIVTDTRVRIESTFSGPTAEPEVLIRTEGGRVGRIGELVFGEPELVLNAACVLFTVAAQGVHHVLGMAQGHYPLWTAADRARYLKPSPKLPELLSAEGLAVQRLAGRELGAARALILKALGT
jgi:hypothetical protein